MKTISAEGAVTETVYNENGRVIETINPVNNSTQNERINADSTSITSEYGNTGLLLKSTDENGNETEYTYI